jgi:hypothetical protein
MTLTNLFKAQAIFAWIWVVMFWFAPEFAAQGPGWEVTPNAVAFGQVASVPILAIGIIAWMAPTLAGDNLKKLGMILGVYTNALFIVVQLFHVSTDAANFDPLGMIPTIIFIALFYWKCQASD